MDWLNKGFIIKVLALLLAILSFWHFEVKGPNYEKEAASRIVVNE